MVTLYTARAVLIDGSVVDLLTFLDREAANTYCAYVKSCRLLGYESVALVERKAIGRATLKMVQSATLLLAYSYAPVIPFELLIAS